MSKIVWKKPPRALQFRHFLRENFLKTDLFLSRTNWFSELSQSSTKTLYWPNFCASGKFLKKQAKKVVFRQFLKFFDQKLRFFGARFPLKSSIEKYQGPSAKNGYLKIVQRGTLWVGKGSNSWGRGRNPP